MGRYSRKDMIEFANFAKSYQSHHNVVAAYKAYLSGDRQFNNYTDEEEVKRIKGIRNKRKKIPKVDPKKVRKIIIY